MTTTISNFKFDENGRKLSNRVENTSELKEFADDNFEFDENGRKLSKQVENTVGKGELACYEQFLLNPQCFQKACFPGGVKRCRCVGMGKNAYTYW